MDNINSDEEACRKILSDRLKNIAKHPKIARHYKPIKKSMADQMLHRIIDEFKENPEYNHVMRESTFHLQPPHIQKEDEILSQIMWDMARLPARCVDVVGTTFRYYDDKRDYYDLFFKNTLSML